MPSSCVWKHFAEMGEIAKCQICKKEVSRKLGSTKGLWSHLERYHKKDIIRLYSILYVLVN